MIRAIDGWHQDDLGDWVAELSCLHNQHVRHQPPFRERPWAATTSGRDARVGSPIECPLCDRLELPAGLLVVRTAGPFDADSLPQAIRREHRVAERTWGLLRVLDGSVEFEIAATPTVRRRIRAGAEQPIPPTVPHLVHVEGAFELAIDFLVKAGP